jgi:hypothetical protein
MGIYCSLIFQALSLTIKITSKSSVFLKADIFIYSRVEWEVPQDIIERKYAKVNWISNLNFTLYRNHLI